MTRPRFIRYLPEEPEHRGSSQISVSRSKFEDLERECRSLEELGRVRVETCDEVLERIEHMRQLRVEIVALAMRLIEREVVP